MAERTMVERVARAICLVSCSPECLQEGPCVSWEMYLADAHAAIEAMRMPTKAMIEAAYAPDDDLVLARLKWEAMLNAALAEGDAAREKAGITQAPSSART